MGYSFYTFQRICLFIHCDLFQEYHKIVVSIYCSMCLEKAQRRQLEPKQAIELVIWLLCGMVFGLRCKFASCSSSDDLCSRSTAFQECISAPPRFLSVYLLSFSAAMLPATTRPLAAMLKCPSNLWSLSGL